ncbi:MAG: TlpA family protein disulfide reductase [Aggregatilineales bacterium]
MRRLRLAHPSLTVWLLLPIIGIVLLITTQQYASAPLQKTSSDPVTSLTTPVTVPTSILTPTALSAGESAPLFVLNGLDGKKHSLQDFRGRIVILNFWATWCPPCRAEMLLLQATYDQLKTQGVIVIGINNKESVATVTQYIQELHITFPILFDPTEGSFQAYQVFGLPTTYFIDSRGQLQDENVGPLTETTLTDYLKRLNAAGRLSELYDSRRIG